MKNWNILIKPASSKCQLACRYCFYADESKSRSVPDYGIMSRQTAEQLIKRSLEAWREPVTVSFLFQGGEPTLAGIDWFRDFHALVQKYQKPYHTIQYALQTNGILINEEWISLFKEYHYLIGVSIDGPAFIHDSLRVTKGEQSTHALVLRHYQKLKQAGVPVNVLTVLSHSLAQHPAEVYYFYREQNIDWVQLIPCLAPLQESSTFALTPHDFANFYIPFHDLWIQDQRAGNEMNVGLFNDVYSLLNSEYPTTCGMLGHCGMQNVSEADGSIYPCDFYVLDAWKLGNVYQNSFKQMETAKKRKQFFQPAKLPAVCSSCPFLNMCHGGCKRQRASFVQADYCGYQEFLRHIMEQS